MDHTIDAQGKKLGRLASQIAVILQGKHKATYDPKNEGTDRVIVTNIKKLELSGRKASYKMYYKHTGPLGHLKERKFEDVFAKNPGWILKHAIRLMLPKNKLSARRLQRVIIEN